MNGEAAFGDEVVFNILSFGFSVGLAGVICTAVVCCGRLLCSSKLLRCCSVGVGDLIVQLDIDRVGVNFGCSVFEALVNDLLNGDAGLATGEGSGV